MPRPFNIVSQQESETLDFDDDDNAVHHHHHAGQTTETNSFFKYNYISPNVKKIICGSIVTIFLIIAISTRSSKSSSHHKKGQWPPPEVNEDDYSDSVLNKEPRDGVPLRFELQLDSTYLENTISTSKTEVDWESMSYTETESANTVNKFETFAMKQDDNLVGMNILITLMHLAVTKEDAGGDITYFSSEAENGDSDFDAVLQQMVGESVTVSVDTNYVITDEEDNESSMEEMEEIISLGTTAALSGLSHVAELTNVISFLPDSPEVLYSPGDSWETEFRVDYYNVSFTGMSTLLGYVKYNGVECAVIKSEAMEEDGMDNFDLDDMGNPVEIEDGDIKTLMFWDVAANIPRYVKSTSVITSEIGGNEEDDFQDAMIVPITVTKVTYFSPA